MNRVEHRLQKLAAHQREARQQAGAWAWPRAVEQAKPRALARSYDRIGEGMRHSQPPTTGSARRLLHDDTPEQAVADGAMLQCWAAAHPEVQGPDPAEARACIMAKLEEMAARIQAGEDIP